MKLIIYSYVSILIMALVGNTLHAQTKTEAIMIIENMQDHKQWLDGLVLVERMLDKYPNDRDLLLKRAVLNDGNGERLIAIGLTIEARWLYPDSTRVIGYLATLYQFSGLLDSALVNRKLCLAMARNRADSFYALLNIGSV